MTFPAPARRIHRAQTAQHQIPETRDRLMVERIDQLTFALPDASNENQLWQK